MPVLGPPPITAAALARKVLSDSDLSWDWGERPIKKLLYDLGHNFEVACRKRGLPENVNIQEWLLDLVWIDKTTRDMTFAVESEWSRVMAHRLDDFEKLMSTKSPLKMFIYATGNHAEGEEVRQRLAEYLQKFSQHLEGEEYLLMDVRKEQAEFYHYKAPNSGLVPNVAFARLQFGLSSSA